MLPRNSSPAFHAMHRNWLIILCLWWQQLIVSFLPWPEPQKLEWVPVSWLGVAVSQENTEAQFFPLTVLARSPPEWSLSPITKTVCGLEPPQFDKTDLKSLCLTAPSVALLASIHSRSCKLSLGLIWFKPDTRIRSVATGCKAVCFQNSSRPAEYK